jgi:hypothetical protein
MSASFKMTFDNYGTPVDIETPPPGDVVGYSQIEKNIQTQMGSSSL